MTRDRLFEIAAKFGLVLATERVTTGHENGAAFRTFEFTHPKCAALKDAVVKA